MNKCHEITLTQGMVWMEMERRMGPAAQGDTLGRRKELLGCG